MAKASRLIRQFKYKEIVLDDPNSEWNTKQVIDFYTGTYPELINSNLEGPSVKEDKMVYTINTKTGTKG